MERVAISISLFSVIVDCKYMYDLMCFSAEKHHSHCEELTAIVSTILRSFTKDGKASVKGISSSNTSLHMVSITPANVCLATCILFQLTHYLNDNVQSMV